MSPNINLSQLAPGEMGRVEKLRNDNPIKTRLTDLGFYPGEAVKVLFRAVCGDPTAYLVQNSVIALRRTEAEKIDISPI